MIRKLCGVCLLSPHSSVGLIADWKMAACVHSVSPGICFWREQSTIYSQKIVFVCFEVSGGYLKNRCKLLAFVSPKLKFSQGEEWPHKGHSLKSF